MRELNYMEKLTIQLAENNANFSRSIQACEQAGIDTQYTMGQAIKDFVTTFHLYDFEDIDLRNKFHDAMHIASNAADSSARSEAIAGITEQVLLREPYNGDLNAQLKAAQKKSINRGALIVGNRKFNPAGDENFEKPAPPASLKSALGLAYERLHETAKTKEVHNHISNTELTQIYEQALQTDEFIRKLTGDRSVYQLSTDELKSTPIAFFGIEKTENNGVTEFPPIPTAKREEIINNLDNKNIALHTINRIKTADELPALGLQLPDQQKQHSEPSTLTAG